MEHEVKECLMSIAWCDEYSGLLAQASTFQDAQLGGVGFALLPMLLSGLAIPRPACSYATICTAVDA